MPLPPALAVFTSMARIYSIYLYIQYILVDSGKKQAVGVYKAMFRVFEALEI